MLRILKVLMAAALAYVGALGPVAAHQRHRADTWHHHHHHHHHRAAKVHYGGKPHLGYWRRGPAKGYGFNFSTYKGDPFGADDYYDGNRCYYVHHENYCMPNHIFNGFD